MARSLVAIVLVVGLCLVSTFVVGCESDAGTGALIGTAVGAGVGQAIGRDTGGTLIGAGVGGAAGYMLGNEGDKKKAVAKAEADKDSLRGEMNTVMVNVTNSNGSVIQVPIRRSGVGYVGPRSEYYDKLPTQDQLRPVYGF